MSAAEFYQFWIEDRMASVSTVSAKGEVHAAPLDPTFEAGKFYILTSGDSQRLKDHRANPRCVISSWEGPHQAVIVYGVARELDDAATRWPGASQNELGMVTIEVTPTRIYAIRPPTVA